MMTNNNNDDDDDNDNGNTTICPFLGVMSDTVFSICMHSHLQQIHYHPPPFANEETEA